jgi:hypothetical protein
MRFLLQAVLAALAAWWPKIQPGGEQTAFLSHSYIKTIFLPRQTRDKHREAQLKKTAFLAGMMQRIPWGEIEKRASGFIQLKRLFHSHTFMKTINCQDRLGTNNRKEA